MSNQSERFTLRYYPPRQSKVVTERDRLLYEEYHASDDASYRSLGKKYGCSAEYIRDRLSLVLAEKAEKAARFRSPNLKGF